MPPHEYHSNINVNEQHDNFIKEISRDVDKHTPIQSRLQRKQPLPSLNSEFRKANIWKISNKLLQGDIFSKQRNFVEKLNRKARHCIVIFFCALCTCMCMLRTLTLK